MFKNVFQIAYVTTDLERAIAVFHDEQGVAEIAVFENFTLDVAGGRDAVINVGLAYVGDVQLEIIEPVSGEVDLYRTWLPDDFAVRHHHFCHRLDSVAELEAVQGRYEQSGSRSRWRPASARPGCSTPTRPRSSTTTRSTPGSPPNPKSSWRRCPGTSADGGSAEHELTHDPRHGRRDRRRQPRRVRRAGRRGPRPAPLPGAPSAIGAR